MPEPCDYQFHHIHIYSSNVAETERWFLEGMGAELVSRHDSRGVPTTTVQIGGANILIRGARTGEQIGKPGPLQFGTNHFGLEVTNVDATIDELRRRGVAIEVEPWDFRPGMRIAFVKGPDAVRIELVQTH